MFKKIACLAIVGVAVASHSASAAQDSGTIAVSATIAASCTIATNPLNFGAALTSTNTADIDVSTTVAVTCANESPYNIGINYGTNASGTQRRMASGANFLTYNVYIDDFGVTPFGPISSFGSGSNYSNPGPVTGTTNVTIYGRINQQTTPPSGTYTDTLTVTVNY